MYYILHIPSGTLVYHNPDDARDYFSIKLAKFKSYKAAKKQLDNAINIGWIYSNLFLDAEVTEGRKEIVSWDHMEAIWNDMKVAVIEEFEIIKRP